MARASAILASALLSVFLLALPAMAQYPPAEDTTAVVSATAVGPGGSINVAGDGWQPGSTVTFVLVSTGADLGSATVDGDGAFGASVTIPAGTPAGGQTIRVSGTGADGAPRTVDIAITVLGAGDDDDDDDGVAAGGAGGGDHLAATGGPVTFSTTSALGALLLVVGGGALYASRRLTRGGTTPQQ